MPQIIAIANQKGGVGKTTTAVNLSYLLARIGHRVLLVDLDPQGNATSGIGQKRSKRQGARLLFLEDQDLGSLTERCLDQKYLLDVVPGTPSLAQTAQEVLRRPPFPVFSNNIQEYRSRYDYIILDCPPSFGALTTAALTVCTHMIIPLQAEYLAMEGVSQMLATFKDVQSKHNPQMIFLGILLTLFDPNVPHCVEIQQEVRNVFKEKLFNSVICRDAALAEAPGYGLPIFEYAPESRGAYDYIHLTKEVLTHDQS